MKSLLTALVGIMAFGAFVKGACDWQPWSPKVLESLMDTCTTPELMAHFAKMVELEYNDVEPVRRFALCTLLLAELFSSRDGLYGDRIAKQFKFLMDEAAILEIVNNCSDNNEQCSSSDVWAYRGFKCITDSKLGQNLKLFFRAKLATRKLSGSEDKHH